MKYMKELKLKPNLAKRIFDLVLAIVVAAPLTFICLLCFVAIYFESGSNPVFRQLRMGQGNHRFWIYKLRTMHVDTQEAASHEVSIAQVTRTGRLLRKYKVDELPQLINVLNGTMSFVGPRPCLPSQHELIAARNLRGVTALKPGITGPAQLAGLDMSTPVKLAEADSQYLEPWSVWTDLLYLWKTCAGSGRGDAVGI